MSSPTSNGTVITTPPVADSDVPPPAGAEPDVPPPVVGEPKMSEKQLNRLKNFYLHHGALGGGRGL
jgi:hypothetical protein